MSRYITSTVCDSMLETEEKLNEWIANGWNLNDFFIQIIGSFNGYYTIFYDAQLNEKK